MPRVASRTDTQVFLLPSPSFLWCWAGLRPPVHKEVCGGDRGSWDSGLGALPVVKKAAVKTSPAASLALPDPRRLRTAKDVLFFAFTGTLAMGKVGREGLECCRLSG